MNKFFQADEFNQDQVYGTGTTTPQVSNTYFQASELDSSQVYGVTDVMQKEKEEEEERKRQEEAQRRQEELERLQKANSNSFGQKLLGLMDTASSPLKGIGDYFFQGGKEYRAGLNKVAKDDDLNVGEKTVAYAEAFSGPLSEIGEGIETSSRSYRGEINEFVSDTREELEQKDESQVGAMGLGEERKGILGAIRNANITAGVIDRTAKKMGYDALVFLNDGAREVGEDLAYWAGANLVDYEGLEKDVERGATGSWNPYQNGLFEAEIITSQMGLLADEYAEATPERRAQIREETKLLQEQLQQNKTYDFAGQTKTQRAAKYAMLAVDISTSGMGSAPAEALEQTGKAAIRTTGREVIEQTGKEVLEEGGERIAKEGLEEGAEKTSKEFLTDAAKNLEPARQGAIEGAIYGGLTEARDDEPSTLQDYLASTASGAVLGGSMGYGLNLGLAGVVPAAIVATGDGLRHISPEGRLAAKKASEAKFEEINGAVLESLRESIPVDNVIAGDSMRVKTKKTQLLAEIVQLDGNIVGGRKLSIPRESQDLYLQIRENVLKPEIAKIYDGETMSIAELQGVVDEVKMRMKAADIPLATSKVVPTPATTRVNQKIMDGQIPEPEEMMRMQREIKNTTGIEAHVKGKYNLATQALLEQGQRESIRNEDLVGKRVRVDWDGKEVAGTVEDGVLRLDTGRSIPLTEKMQERIRRDFDISGVTTSEKFQVEDPLMTAVQKFESGEDFYQRLSGEDRALARDRGMQFKGDYLKYWEENKTKVDVLSPDKAQTADEYVKAVKENPLIGAMDHRPSKAGPGFNISKDGAIPEDVYDSPEKYFSFRGNDDYAKSTRESLKVLRKIKDNPEAEVTIYRASPKNGLRYGDWITLSENYAKGESLSEEVPVNSFTVKAKDIQFAGDDLNEFGYFPTDETLKAEFENIKRRNQTQSTATKITREEASEIIGRYFEEGEIKIRFVQILETPEGQRAIGQYFDGVIDMIDNPNADTPEHEVLHAYFDMFTSKKRQTKVIDQVMKERRSDVQKIAKEKGLDELTAAEEWMADNFAEYAKGRRDMSLGQRVLEFFDEILNNIRGLAGRKDEVKALYRDIIAKKREKGTRAERIAKFQTEDFDIEKFLDDIFDVKPDSTFTSKTVTEAGEEIVTEKPYFDALDEMNASEVSQATIERKEALVQSRQALEVEIGDNEAMLGAINDAIDSNPAKDLRKYTRGSWYLPDVTGEGKPRPQYRVKKDADGKTMMGPDGKPIREQVGMSRPFSKEGDQIVSELGFSDINEAQSALDIVNKDVEKRKEIISKLRSKKEEWKELSAQEANLFLDEINAQGPLTETRISGFFRKRRNTTKYMDKEVVYEGVNMGKADSLADDLITNHPQIALEIATFDRISGNKAVDTRVALKVAEHYESIGDVQTAGMIQSIVSVPISESASQLKMADDGKVDLDPGKAIRKITANRRSKNVNRIARETKKVKKQIEDIGVVDVKRLQSIVDKITCA